MPDEPVMKLCSCYREQARPVNPAEHLCAERTCEECRGKQNRHDGITKSLPHA